MFHLVWGNIFMWASEQIPTNIHYSVWGARNSLTQIQILGHLPLRKSMSPFSPHFTASRCCFQVMKPALADGQTFQALCQLFCTEAEGAVGWHPSCPCAHWCAFVCWRRLVLASLCCQSWSHVTMAFPRLGMLMPCSPLYFTVAGIQASWGSKANLSIGIWALWESTRCSKTNMALFYDPDHMTVMGSAMATIKGCLIAVTTSTLDN